MSRTDFIVLQITLLAAALGAAAATGYSLTAALMCYVAGGMCYLQGRGVERRRQEQERTP